MNAIETEIKEMLVKINADIQEIKISQARNEEKLNGIDRRLESFEKTVNTRFGNLETQVNKQDNRFWTFVLLLGSSLVGVVTKLVFFPTKPF